MYDPDHIWRDPKGPYCPNPGCDFELEFQYRGGYHYWVCKDCKNKDRKNEFMCSYETYDGARDYVKKKLEADRRKKEMHKTEDMDKP